MTATLPAGRDVELLRAFVDRIDQNDPGAFNNLGVLFFSKGLLSEAVDAFLRALSLDPRMRTAARNLEIVASEPGACDAHLAQLDETVEREPDDLESQRQRAHLLRLIGRHQDAARAFDVLIAENPDDGAALFERGLIEQRNGDLRRAQRWFERATVAAPADAAARLHLAEVLYQRGQNEQSLDALDELLSIAPDLAEAHLLRGFVLGDMGHHEAGLAAARHAASLNPQLGAVQTDLSIDAMIGASNSRGITSNAVLGVEPDSGMARYGLGLAFRQRGYFAEARREFERAIESGEDARSSRHAIAELDLISGAHDSAHAAYSALLAEWPEEARYWNEHGVSLHQRGDLAGAAASYRRALQCEPRYAIAYNNLGVSLADIGDGAAAREAFTRAIEIDAPLVAARLNLARWYLRQRDALAALGVLRELTAFRVMEADAWYEMGRAMNELHRPGDARDAFVRAIELRANHAEARYALAETLTALGDEDGALRETQSALGLAPLRVESRLTVAVDLQRECPDAVGGIDLLSMGGGTPLAGIAIGGALVEALLPERADAKSEARKPVDPLAEHAVDCDSADSFAARGLHGESLERYARVRAALDTLLAPSADAIASDATSAPPKELQALWCRAAKGEARAQCLLGDGHRALPLLRTLGSADPRDAETLALFACSAASAARNGEDVSAAARTAMLRLLRLDAVSAALMHFVGDAAVSIDEESVALAFYRRALALDPARPSARVAIASLLRRRGDLLAARLELAAAIAVAPRLGGAALELARVHRDAARPLEALAVLTEHLAHNSTDIAGLVLLGEILIALDRAVDARVALARALRHAPDDSGALWFEGSLLSRQGREREAQERWNRAALGGEGEYAALARQALAAAPSMRRVS